MQEFLSVIRSSTLFSGISEQELTAMLACLGTKASRFPKDALLLRAGDTAESIGLVLSGSVLVEQEDVWGNRNILSKAGPGQTFAAAYACAPGSVLKVSVAAETPATVLFLNVKRVLTMCPSACARHSRIIRNLLGELAEKNLRFGEKLTHMGQRTTRAKIMSYLSAEAQRPVAGAWTDEKGRRPRVSQEPLSPADMTEKRGLWSRRKNNCSTSCFFDWTVVLFSVRNGLTPGVSMDESERKRGIAYVSDRH